MTRSLAATLLLLTLAACGGGTTTDPGPDPDETLGEDRDAVTGMDDTAGGDLPVTGEATYTGSAEVTAAGGISAIGAATIEVDFEAGEASGDALDFSISGADAAGALSIDGAIIDTGTDGPGQLNAEIGGAITAGDGTALVVFPLDAVGNFTGADGSGIELTGDGTVSVDGVEGDGAVAVFVLAE